MVVYGHSPLPLAICYLPKILLPWYPVICRGRWHDDNIKAADVLCDDGNLVVCFPLFCCRCVCRRDKYIWLDCLFGTELFTGYPMSDRLQISERTYNTRILIQDMINCICSLSLSSLYNKMLHVLIIGHALEENLLGRKKKNFMRWIHLMTLSKYLPDYFLNSSYSLYFIYVICKTSKYYTY